MGKRGMLVFKGDVPKKKKSKKSKHSTKNKNTEVVVQTPVSSSAAAAAVVASAQSQSAPSAGPSVPSMVTATGKITTSGAVVTGHGTKFQKELSPGDAMVVRVGERDEMRVVKMRLSNTSCGISSAFSKDLSAPITFSVIRKPRDEKREARAKKEKSMLSQKEAEDLAQGTYAGNNAFVYRERTEHGSYRIQKVDLNESMSRGQLLAMRSKKTSDKYC